MAYEILKNHIGGDRISSSSTERREVHDPATGEVIAQVPMSTPEKVGRAMAAAREASPEWRETLPDVELNTFGAILRFAMEWERRAIAFYEENARNHWLASFLELAQGARRRLRRLEQARQEGIAEMILEPITGLDSASYRLEQPKEADSDALLGYARNLEEMAAHFYQDAAARMPIREVARLFQNLAQENLKRGENLSRCF